jgi:hypothetical protein
MDSTDPYSEGILDVVCDLSNTAAHKARLLKAEAEKATHTRRAWEELTTFIERRWPLHILALIERESELVAQTAKENEAAGTALNELARASRERAEAVMRRFPSLMEEACARSQFPVDRDSRHPRYRFDGGFFQVDVDERKRSAKISDYEGQLHEMPADVEAVVEAVRGEHERVFGRKFDRDRFLKKLRAQYETLLKKEGLPEGSSLPIRRITGRLGKNEKGFRTDEFLIDLSRLAEQGPLEVDGFVLDLQQTKDTQQGMLLHGAAGRGYVGFITFRKA